MRNGKYRVAIITGPRHGGPLRWAKDLTAGINASGEAEAMLIHATPAILASQWRVDADIVHSTLPITWRVWRKPLVLTVKGDYTIEARIWRPLYAWSIRHAQAVTVPSQYLRQRVPALHQATVIPNAVDLQQFQQHEPSQASPVKFVMVTNFWYPDKVAGVKTVINCFRRATEVANISAQLTIAGTGKYLEEVKAYSQKTGVPVDFTGWVDTNQILQQAEVFLYYSYHDNMPNAVLEAMAAGLPVLTNTVGAIPEMINHRRDGFVAQNDEEYVQLLIEIMSDATLRKQLGTNARRRIEADFSWNQVIRKYLNIYQQLIG